MCRVVYKWTGRCPRFELQEDNRRLAVTNGLANELVGSAKSRRLRDAWLEMMLAAGESREIELPVTSPVSTQRYLFWGRVARQQWCKLVQ